MFSWNHSEQPYSNNNRNRADITKRHIVLGNMIKKYIKFRGALKLKKIADYVDCRGCC